MPWRDSPARLLRTSNVVTLFTLLSAGLAVASAREFTSRALVGYFLGLATLASVLTEPFAGLFPRGVENAKFGRRLTAIADAVAFGAAPLFCVGQFMDEPAGLRAWGWWALGCGYVAAVSVRSAYSTVRDEASAGAGGLPLGYLGFLWSAVFLLEFSPAMTGMLFALGTVLSLAPMRITAPQGSVLYVAFLLSALLSAVHLLRSLGP